MVSVVIADDHAVVRTGLQLIFADNNIVVDGEADSGEALLALLKNRRFDVAVLDVNMPGMPCLALLLRMRQLSASLPVVIFSMNKDEELASNMFKHGVNAYINKEEDPKELVKAVAEAANHKRYLTRQQELYFANQVLSGYHKPSEREKLTKREYQIGCLLASGNSLTSIARMLNISKNTISNHRNNILKKLNLANNVELTKYAINHHMIQ